MALYIRCWRYVRIVIDLVIAGNLWRYFKAVLWKASIGDLGRYLDYVSLLDMGMCSRSVSVLDFRFLLYRNGVSCGMDKRRLVIDDVCV